MKKTTIVWAVAAATLAFAPITVAFAQHADGHGSPQGTHQGGHAMPMGMSGMMALKRLSGRAFDSAFLSQMIGHHQGALDMTRDALLTLKNAHVKKHARNIIADQKKEIAEMRALLQRDFKTQPSQAQMNLMKHDMHAMMAMKMTGDRAFLQMMIPHHQGANDMSRLALAKSKNPKVRSLAQRIIKAQTAEIADFQRLLKSGNLAAAAMPQTAAMYQCEKCKMTFSAADAKKMSYQCSMKDGKLVAVKGH